MLRQLLCASLKAEIKHPEEGVALLYSGGYESLSILCSLLDIGIRPKLYNFCLEGYNSFDTQKANEDAKTFDLPIEVIYIPSDYETLRSDVQRLVGMFGARKTVVQCLHPMIYTIPRITEKYVVYGLERGNIWGLNKRGAIWGPRWTLAEFNEYRRGKEEEDSRNSTFFIENYITSCGHVSVRPYNDDNVVDFFFSKTWVELNRPHKKQLILDEFGDEIQKCSRPPKKNRLPDRLWNQGVPRPTTPRPLPESQRVQVRRRNIQPNLSRPDVKEGGPFR